MSPAAQRKPKDSKARFSRLTNGCACNAVSAFANCGRAVAHVRGSYVPIGCIEWPTESAFDYVSRVSSFRYCATLVRAAECSKFCAVSIKNARKLGVRAC
jgi:hypothetical protein